MIIVGKEGRWRGADQNYARLHLDKQQTSACPQPRTGNTQIRDVRLRFSMLVSYDRLTLSFWLPREA
jgi:hypothetical protein